MVGNLNESDITKFDILQILMSLLPGHSLQCVLHDPSQNSQNLASTFTNIRMQKSTYFRKQYKQIFFTLKKDHKFLTKNWMIFDMFNLPIVFSN